MELFNALGAFVYFAFPGCFQLLLFGAFTVNFWGQVLVSLTPPGRASLAGIKHSHFPNFFSFNSLNFPFPPLIFSTADQWTEEWKGKLKP